MPAQKLAWNDKWVDRLVQELEGADCDTSAPYVFNSGDNYILFKFTPQQFNEVLSALAVGADFAYPEKAHQVYWNFVKAVECPMQICELFIECLENDEDTINALAQLIINNPTIRNAVAQAAAAEGIPAPSTPLSTQATAAQMLPDNVSTEGECDANALWGGILNVVQTGKATITDAFDILESATNALERASIAADLIPVVGTYPAQAAQFADQLLEEIAEGFEAAYTVPYEQALACELFCLARENCELSLDDVIEMFIIRLSTIDFDDYLQFMNYIITGTFVGDQIADAAYLCYFLALKYGSQFLDIIGIQTLTVQIGLGADVLSSDNWETLCDECGWTYNVNFNIGLGNWAVSSGTYIEGTGVQNNPASAFPYTVQVGLAVADWGTSELTNWRITAYSENADGGAFRGMVYVTSGVPTYQDIGGGETGSYYLAGTSSEAQPDEIYAQISNASVAGINLIVAMRLSGIGDMPTFSNP